MDDTVDSGLTLTDPEEAAQALKPLQKQFVESYLHKQDDVPLEKWLQSEMAQSLPEKSETEISQFCDDILSTLTTQDKEKASLEQAVDRGESKESWFARRMKQATAHMSTRDTVRYMQNLDTAVADANRALCQVGRTQTGAINQNPNLDGFIAEQYHAQTFNMNMTARTGELEGNPFQARVLPPSSSGYGKDSVDIVVSGPNDGRGTHYQSKYGRDTQATEQAFNGGNYRGQKKLVPAGQEGDIPNASAVLESPDGVTSNPLTKEQAKQLQADIQSGRTDLLDWNEYKARDIAKNIGKQSGQAAMLGMAVGVGFDVAQKIWNGEDIDGSDLVESAVSSGADFGIKTAMSGAVKVGVEKGYIPLLPKGTPAGTIASIVQVGVEDAKVIGEVIDDDLTLEEGMAKIEQTTVSVTAGIAASTEGAAMGAAIGSVLGPPGAFVGGLVGGAIGYMAGSTVGEAVVAVVQDIRDAARDVASAVVDTVRDAADALWSGVTGVVGGVLSFLGF